MTGADVWLIILAAVAGGLVASAAMLAVGWRIIREAAQPQPQPEATTAVVVAAEEKPAPADGQIADPTIYRPSPIVVIAQASLSKLNGDARYRTLQPLVQSQGIGRRVFTQTMRQYEGKRFWVQGRQVLLRRQNVQGGYSRKFVVMR